MRLRPGYIIIAVGLAVVAGIIAYGLVHPTSKPPPPVKPAAGPPGQPQGPLPGDLSIQGSRVTKTDPQGNPEWTLQAPSAVQVQAGSTQAEAKNVKWSLLQGNQTEWIVDAPEVVIEYKPGRLVFSNGVKVRSADGSRQFSSDRLTYEPDSKRLVGEGEAQFSMGSMWMTGKNLVVDTRQNKVYFTGTHAHIGK
jgi:LPS export ABC transporter protein LptC